MTVPADPGNHQQDVKTAHLAHTPFLIHACLKKNHRAPAIARDGVNLRKSNGFGTLGMMMER